MSIIEIRALNKFYGQTPNELHVLKDIDLSIERGEFVAIIGQSGSGKSTLMNMLGCLDTPTSGSYRIDGVEAGGMSKDQLADLRSSTFGFIFQRYNLIGSMSALDNVAMPLGYARIPPVQRRERAQAALAAVGLGARVDHRPNELSGGQQQRVAIARALVNSPSLLLADEPTGALDSRTGEEILTLFKNLRDEGHTVILITHDAHVAAHADRICVMHDGQLREASHAEVAA